jgi:hypothetical protein
MLRGLMKAGGVLLGLAVVLVGLSYNVLRAQGLESAPTMADRTVGSEARPVDGKVTIVKVAGPVDLVLKQGPAAAMTVRAERRVLSRIRTIQDGGTLQIDTKGLLVNVREPMVVELTLPSLQRLQVLGSGNGRISGFSGDALQLDLTGSGDVDFNGQYRRIAASMTGSGNLTLNGGNSDNVELSLLGSGDINASGSSKTLKASLSGSGDLDARQLAADSVDLSLLGSGDAEVAAKNAVSARIRGSGNATIAGKPAQRAVSVTGSGEVGWE